ncbi:MAG: terminase family protein [bacterium]
MESPAASGDGSDSPILGAEPGDTDSNSARQQPQKQPDRPGNFSNDLWRRGLAAPDLFATDILGLRLHDGQRRWLRLSQTPENILATGNRWGKSFISAVKILHHALYRPRPLCFDGDGRYRIVSASITQDQAGIVFDQVVRLVRQRPWLESLAISLVRTPFPTLEFGNGAVVEARSTQNRGEYLLGHDYDLFVFDEVAFEPEAEYVGEEVIQMRLADREGRLDLISTPNGRNWFYRRAMEIGKGRRSGYLQYGDTRENSFISSAFIADRVRHFSERRIQQNIQGRFVDAGGEILKGEYIDQALAGLGHPSSADGETRLISGWDLARKQTATVGITVAVTGGRAEVVALERFRQFDWNVVIQRICQRQIQFPGQLVVDATGLGDVVVEQLRQYNPLAVIFTPTTKAELLTNVELFHARGQIGYERWELPDGPGRIWSLEDELREARWDDNNRCDALMALALALWPLRYRGCLPVAPRLGKV